MIGIDNCDYRFCHLQIKVVRQSLPHRHHRQPVVRPIVAKQRNHNPRVGGSSPSSATISFPNFLCTPLITACVCCCCDVTTIGAKLAFCHPKSDQRVTKVAPRLHSHENIIASRAASLKDNYARLVTALSR